MPPELHAPTIGEVVGLVRGTTYKSVLLGQPGPVLLGLASIQRHGGFRGDSLKTYGGESKPNQLLIPGDLFVSLKDVTQSADLLGAVARVPASVPSGRLTQDTVKLDFGNNRYPRSLVYWTLRTPQYRAYCRGHSTGTTNLGLPREDFLAYRLPAPTSDALSLVETLEALDDRIDNLRQTNATLEAIAATLFKSWFVDFDGVTQENMQESELGLIPKGWTVRSLDSIADYLNGLALQKFPPESETEFLPVIKIAQLRARHTNGSDRASARLKPEYIVEDGDVLFSWSGSLEVEVWTGGRGALNQHLFKVTSREVPKWFYYFATRQHLSDFRTIAAGKATTMGHIQRGHLAAAKVTVPSQDEMAKFDAIIAPIFEQTISNALQARPLSTLRDALLPRLISGKLRIGEAARLADEIA